MARGNQRENDREKAQKKLAGNAKKDPLAPSLANKRQADALAMQAKLVIAADKKAAEAAIIAAGGTIEVKVKDPGSRAPVKALPKKDKF